MKRIAVIFKLLIAAVIVLNAVPAFTQESSAYIRECTGTVEIMLPGETDWMAAEPGQQLSGNTLISTGFKSTALVTLGNSTLIIRPLTRLTLDEIVNIQGNETVGIKIQTGRVRAEVKPPAGGVTNFTVQSPMVTASVRGTSFDFDGRNLTVNEGLVHIVGGDRAGVYVGAGQRSFSNPQTGKTTGGELTFREDLSFSIPPAAAAGAGIPAPTVGISGPPAPIRLPPVIIPPAPSPPPPPPTPQGLGIELEF